MRIGEIHDQNLYGLALGLISAPVQAQWIHQPTPGIPRTTDGHPSLRAQPPKAADGQPDSSCLWTLVPGKGGISQLKPSEMKPWAEALHKERRQESSGAIAQARNAFRKALSPLGKPRSSKRPS